MCMIILPEYICVLCTHSAHKGQKRVSDPMRLELYTVSHWCGSWNWTQVQKKEQSVLLTNEPSFQPVLNRFGIDLLVGVFACRVKVVVAESTVLYE